MEIEKKCTKCNIIKHLSLFTKNKSKKSGYESNCKECKKEYDKHYRKINAEKIKNYREDNKVEHSIKHKKYLKENKESITNQRREYYDNNKEEIKEKSRRYFAENKESKRLYDKNYRKWRKENDPLYKLKINIRSSIRQSIKDRGFRKSCKTNEILGCSFKEFKEHIENQFEPWMNWNNHGNWNGIPKYFNTAWDLDHIIPVGSAKTEEDIIRLNHYTNFQPLCSYTNRNIKRDNM